MTGEKKALGTGTILVVVLFFLYLAGGLDTFAAKAGLPTRNPCAVVYATGEIICGSAMEAFCASQGCNPAP